MNWYRRKGRGGEGGGGGRKRGGRGREKEERDGYGWREGEESYVGGGTIAWGSDRGRFFVRIGSRGKRSMHVHPWNVEER